VGFIVHGRSAEPNEEVALLRSTPEAQGVSSASVLKFVEAIEQVDTMNSFMLLRHGRAIAEGWWAPYEPGSRHALYSLAKCFTATAVGIAAEEHRLSIDDKVLALFPNDTPSEPSENLKAMRVRDLLRMSTGHQDGPAVAPDKMSARTFLAQPGPFKPGTHFLYNTAAAFMLSAIVQKPTGQTVLDYLRPRLFEPLGISQPVWGTNFQGITLGGYGLSLRTEDVARFGQLYLQNGNWNGKQLIPASWIEAATALQVSTGSDPSKDFEQGYGYQFWRGRHGTYFGIGWAGQYCLILPHQDAVVIITAGLGDMNEIFDLVWKHLLPAFHQNALAAEPAASTALRAKLAGLSLRTSNGASQSPVTAKILGRKYVFPVNNQKIESVMFQSDPGGTNLNLVAHEAGAEHRLELGLQTWCRGRGPLLPLSDEQLATKATWTSDDVLAVSVCAPETPYSVTLRFRFEGDRVVRDWQSNGGWVEGNQAPLIGVAQSR